jgi:hypothetical protein
MYGTTNTKFITNLLRLNKLTYEATLLKNCTPAPLAMRISVHLNDEP